jgi:MerR-like DNA binding protein
LTPTLQPVRRFIASAAANRDHTAFSRRRFQTPQVIKTDETGLLKPAYLGANGYRFYEEPQLLTLQQILFYRELGFELKQIKRILGRSGFICQRFA